MVKLRLSSTEEEVMIRQHERNERIKRMMAVRHGEIVRSKRMLARMKLDRDLKSKQNKQRNIIHHINSRKEELKALLQAKEDIKATLNQGQRDATVIAAVASSHNTRPSRDEKLIWQRYQDALDTLHQERAYLEEEDDKVMTRILNARYKANKLSSSYKPKDTLLLPTSDDIFMAINDDKKRGAWVSQDLLTQYAETAYHMYQPHEDNGEVGGQSVKDDYSRKRKQATIPHNWDGIVADRGREALMKERERIRCEEAQRDMELRHFIMERKANADKVVARIPTVGKAGKGNKKGGHKQEATTAAAAAAGVAVGTPKEDAIISPLPEEQASTEQEGQAGNEDKGYAVLGTKGDVQEVARHVSQEEGGSEDLDQPEGSTPLEEKGQGPQLQEDKQGPQLQEEKGPQLQEEQGPQLQEEKGQGPQFQEEKGPQLQEEQGPQLQEEKGKGPQFQEKGKGPQLQEGESSLEAREGRGMNRADQQGRAEQLIDHLAPDGGIKRAAGKLDAAGVEGNAADHRTPPVGLLEYGSEDITNIPEQSAYSESIGHESLHREPTHAQGADVQQYIREKPRDVPSSATGAGALSLSLLSYPSEDTTDSIEQLLRHYEIPAMVEEESCVVVGDEEIVEDDWKVQLDNLKKELDEIYASCTDVSRSSTSKVADSHDASRRNEDISDTTLMLSEEESASFTSTELVAAIAEVTAGISGPYLGQASDYDEDRCLGATIAARGNIREPDGPTVTLFHFDSAPPDVLANNTSSSIPFMVHASVLSVSEGPYWSPALLPQGLTCLSHNKSITESIFPFKDSLSSLPNIFTLSNSNLSAIVLHSADVASATGMPLSRLISELAARDDVTDVRQKYGCQRLLSYTHTEKGVTILAESCTLLSPMCHIRHLQGPSQTCALTHQRRDIIGDGAHRQLYAALQGLPPSTDGSPTAVALEWLPSELFVDPDELYDNSMLGTHPLAPVVIPAPPIDISIPSGDTRVRGMVLWSSGGIVVLATILLLNTIIRALSLQQRQQEDKKKKNE
ncbi:hypothetical protein FOZ61_010795 [Perkinsus olseni]|uniref:Uncharacterized protein n=1 Tax=Perkinsus olseni TaxID=32597 RepID=A0A7J6KW39_PEROL|nr:hypothetical protein FOZ61_010795 [Perkinsus olseni]